MAQGPYEEVKFLQKRHHLFTLPETNIAPENRPSQNESSGAMLVLGRVKEIV